MQSQPSRAWKLGLTTSHGSQVLSPKYDMDAYMVTLFGCFVVEWGRAKARLNSQPKSHEHFCIKQSRSDFNDI